MATTLPFVVYWPWNVLQPEDPDTLRRRKAAVSSVPESGTAAVPVVVASEVDDPRAEQRVGRSGIEHEQDRGVPAADRERVAPHVVEAAVLE